MIITRSSPNRKSIVLIGVLLFLAYARPAHAQLSLASSDITPGAAIGNDYACTGADHSPALAWSGAPQSTKSFALIVDDTDAPGGTFIHWIAFNIPAGVNSLPAGVSQTAEIPGGGSNGINSFGHYGYNGPCPPPGKTHHYHFRIYALDSALPAVDNAHADAIQSAMQGHVLATAEFAGTFER
jgi:Raf kinase inhibitor-like YbhB/YbcL family protein